MEWLDINNEEIEENVINPIKKLRVSLNMNTKKFAEFINVNHEFLKYFIEKGKCKNIEEVVCKIGHSFNVNEGKLIQEYKELYHK